MSSVDMRWIVFLTVDDRSGTVTALAECFSTRGVSFEAFNTLDVHDGGGAMAVVFRGSERIARVLARTLERLAVVRTVTLERTDDPRVRAIGSVTLPEGSSAQAVLADAGAEVAVEVAAPWAGDAVLLAGSLPHVEAALVAARAAGATGVAVTVLPPAE